jgi:hypothetical protein
MEDPEEDPGISPIAVTAVAIVFLLAVLLLYRYLTAP